MQNLKRRVVSAGQRLVVNPVARRLPLTMLETNIKANPAVRVRVRGRWHNGTAHLLPGDDPIQRLHSLPGVNSALVRAMGTDLLTIRVDLD